ncbi:urokinase plasminogen activator surface receptor-like [Spea bombifrons]|uniref:urokinase plasminogen activator surface receptor-like n=1 Tax=Spea bombifrons TaxID=233779 RepID=UPI00234BFC4D|nr:urokinase plasminogen activator surface receptor-like [Spea bombifrons]
MVTMRLAYTLLFLAFCSIKEGRGLQCFSCVGSNDQECNRQGSLQCPRDSDACAIIRGQSSGVMKSCSFKSFCDRALREGSKAPGVSVQCCFSNNCNSGSQGSGSQLSASYARLLGFLALVLCLLIIT